MATLASLYKHAFRYDYSVSTESTTNYQIHCHNHYEIYYIIDGDVSYMIEGHQYDLKPHSLLLLPPNSFHGVRIDSTRPYMRQVIHFLPEAIPEESRQQLLAIFPAHMKRTPASLHFEKIEKYRLESFYQNFSDCSNMPDSLRDTCIPIFLQALLGQLSFMVTEEHPRMDVAFKEDSVDLIISYINRHLCDDLRLENLAERFFISPNHLNRIFRNATGTTVGRYITYKRISYAKQKLIEGYSASDAAMLCGFHDYSAFYRAYVKIWGHSPLQDRGCLPKILI